MFNWLFGKKETEEDIQTEKLVRHLHEKYGVDFEAVISTVYDDDGEKRINCISTAQELAGRTFEADAECGGEEITDCSDGFLHARYADSIKSYADEILDKVFPHYTSVLDNDNSDTESPDRNGTDDLDSFIRPKEEDCSGICFTVITDMDRDSVEALLPKLLQLIKEKNIRLEILVNIVPPDRYQEESDKLVAGGAGCICRSSLYYAFVNYYDEPEDLQVAEKEDN